MLVVICVFPHWVEAFPCHRATASTGNKAFLLGLSPQSSVGTQERIPQDTLYSLLVKIWLILQHFHCVYHPQSSGLKEWTNKVINTQLAKPVKSFHLPWPKALPLVLLNLNLSSSANTGRFFLKLLPVDVLDQIKKCINPAQLKGGLLTYCKELLRVLTTNSQLIQQSFHNTLLGGGDL